MSIESRRAWKLTLDALAEAQTKQEELREQARHELEAKAPERAAQEALENPVATQRSNLFDLTQRILDALPSRFSKFEAHAPGEKNEFDSPDRLWSYIENDSSQHSRGNYICVARISEYLWDVSFEDAIDYGGGTFWSMQNSAEQVFKTVLAFFQSDRTDVNHPHHCDWIANNATPADRRQPITTSLPLPIIVVDEAHVFYTQTLDIKPSRMGFGFAVKQRVTERVTQPSPAEITQARLRAGLNQTQAAELISPAQTAARKTWSGYEQEVGNQNHRAISLASWELFLLLTHQHPSLELRERETTPSNKVK